MPTTRPAMDAPTMGRLCRWKMARLRERWFWSAVPLATAAVFLGMVGAVVDLQFLIRRLHEVSGGGLIPYVVDAQGRLVAAGTPQYVTGQDMKSLEIVRNFCGRGEQGAVGRHQGIHRQGRKERR